MPKIDIDALPRRTGCGYPPPFDQPCHGRARTPLGDAGGLTDFGVNLLELPPGGWSSQRHWHSAEDEFVWVLEGEVVLIDDQGEHAMRAGDCATFRKGDPNGHHLVNRSGQPARCLEVGSRKPDDDACDYPDVDLYIGPGHDAGYVHKNQEPYPTKG
ncbi:MAG: cupin domain-containing protein [Rhodanobacteraceae bacterium]|nr:MAG: cupin domain-containing protein [Rhodanobacteraceae bacterium]